MSRWVQAQRLRRRLGDSKLGLLFIGCALLAATFAEPQWPHKRSFYSYLFVFDITQSMNVVDAGPVEARMTRLQFAQAAVRKVLDDLPCGSEVGFSIFTQHRSFLLFAPVEVCKHFAETLTMLEAIDWRMAWASRSEVAKGLFSSVAVAEALGQDVAVVFLTDGHEAPPIHPVYRPHFRGTRGEVKGVVVGVGSHNPAPIPKLDRSGKLRGYWAASEVPQVDSYSLGRRAGVVDEAMVGVDVSDVKERISAGREHLSSLRESHLRELANETGFDYLLLQRLDDLGSALKRHQFARREVVPVDVRWVLASAALLCLIFIYIFRDRPRFSFDQNEG